MIDTLNDTPTTDARWETLCCSGQSWYQIAEEMKLDCRQRERELTAVTEQRDRLAAALERILEYQGRFAEEDPESIAAEALAAVEGGEP
jgi:hypothetical protein